MSGAAGHMNHLYDNPDLSFDEIISILKSASNGKLEGTEKLDGVNVFLGFSGGVAKAARKEGDIANGGLDLQAVLEREFAGGPKMQQVYANAVKAFDAAVASLSDEERVAVFGEQGEKFYNAEILHTDAQNVVSYTGNIISIHRQGHKHLNPETQTVETFDASKTAAALDAAVNKFEIMLGGDKPPGEKDDPNAYKFRRAAIKQLEGLANDEDLNLAIARINKAVSAAGVGTSDTVADYLKARISAVMPNIPEQYMDVAARRMVAELPWRSPEVNNLPKDVKKELSGYWQNAATMHKTAIYPIEEAIHTFSVEILKSIESGFIIDQDKETERLRGVVAQAKTEIESYVSQGLEGSDRANEIFTAQMTKLGDIEQISTPVEGFVFEHDGILYKFTGNFAPINQIVGLWKWGRGKQVPSISQALAAQEPAPETEQEIDEAERPTEGAQRIAVVPGGFKPPHAGHFLGAEWFLSGNVVEPADMVYILISPKSRFGHAKDGRDGRGVEITKEMSKQLWDLYIKENGLGSQMKAIITEKDSPVAAAYDFMEKLRSGQTLILGKGAKDASDKRFDQAQVWSDKKGYGLDVEIVDTPMMAGGISGSDMRRFIADGDYDNFKNYVPLKDASAAWEIVRPDIEEPTESPPQPEGVAESFMPFLCGLIREELEDRTKELEEISAMSTGAVEGASGTNIKKKQYNAWEPSKFEKEIIQELRGEEDTDVITLDYGLQLSRGELPQIASTDVPQFLEWLEAQDIATEPDIVDPEKLTPIQKEINLDKVAGMIANKGLEALAMEKPVIISGDSDNYLIDGHHRWYALLDNEYPKISVVRVGMNAKDLISFMKEWDKTGYKEITHEHLAEDIEERLVSHVLNYLKENPTATLRRI